MVDDLMATVIINSVLFYIFRTYHGIIRLSGFQEAFRSISAVFYSFFVMLLINVGLRGFGLPSFIPTSVLFIYFFISSLNLSYCSNWL
jgi:FlaA1/EpsC-like NDP-sugar epimerase